MALFDGKVVVITGASAGVGRATAREFAQHGASTGLLARGDAGLQGAKDDVERAGGRALIVPTDVADADQVEDAAETIERELGPIDIWVNNAMVSVFARADQIKPDEYRRVTEVNYLGYVFGTLAALKRMRSRNRGKIIQVSSALAFRGIPLQAAYCGSKHAIEGFTDSVRTELIHDGLDIGLTLVHLPAVNTPQFGWVRNRLGHQAQPVPPIFQPEVPANAILWAAGHNRRDVYVGLPAARAIIGNKLFPRIGDIYLARNGFESQQTDQLLSEHYQDNLWQPQDNDHDHGSQGEFSNKSLPSSWYLAMVKNRTWLAAVFASFIGFLGVLGIAEAVDSDKG